MDDLKMDATQMFGTDLALPSPAGDGGPSPVERQTKRSPAKKRAGRPRGSGRASGRGRAGRRRAESPAEASPAMEISEPSGKPQQKQSRRKTAPVKSTPADAYPMPSSPSARLFLS